VGRRGELSNVWCEEGRGSDIVEEFLVSRFKELDNCPHGNVLECGIRAAEEAMKVFVQAALWLIPNIIECTIIIIG